MSTSCYKASFPAMFKAFYYFCVPAGGSVCSTPVSECESLMESLLLDIKNGLGRRSLRRPHDPSPSPGKWSHKFLECMAISHFTRFEFQYNIELQGLLLTFL